MVADGRGDRVPRRPEKAIAEPIKPVEHIPVLEIVEQVTFKEDDLRAQPLKVDVIAIGVNAPLQAMLARSAGLPQDFEPDLAGRALLVENDLVHDEAQDALAFGRGSRCGVPNPR